MLTLIKLLLPALAMWESSGDINAVGDFDKKLYTKEYITSVVVCNDIEQYRKIDPAIGMFQIHWRYWSDGTAALKVKWPYKDAFNPVRAEAVTKAYLTKYGMHYERMTGQPVTLEVLARIHNGGPNGWKIKATIRYWHIIERILKRKLATK